MLKEQKGITLIALVITIIVLLILAGVTIAMLSGENGILSRATETRSTNAEAQATEQAKLAYMAVRTEIAAQMVEDGNYSAASSATTLASGQVSPELPSSEGWTVTPTNGTKTTDGKIVMVYHNNALKDDLTFTITLAQKTATFE